MDDITYCLVTKQYNRNGLDSRPLYHFYGFDHDKYKNKFWDAIRESMIRLSFDFDTIVDNLLKQGFTPVFDKFNIDGKYLFEKK